MKKVISVIRNLAFVLLVLFICFIIYTMSQGNTVSIAGYRVLRVLTSSMEPSIVENTCIITKEIPTEDLKVGDIITFKSEDPAIYGYYNTHRIHEIKEEGGVRKFITKGDNSSDIDPYPVSESNVVGIYVQELPGGRLIGQAFVVLSDNKIYFAVIIIPLVLCLLSYFWEIMGMVTGRYQDDEDDDDEVEETKEVKEVVEEVKDKAEE